MTPHLHTYIHLDIQWNPSGKARKVSLKLQNLVRFHAPFFTNYVLFYPSWQATSFERPPSWVAFIEGFHFIHIYIYRGVPLYTYMYKDHIHHIDDLARDSGNTIRNALELLQFCTKPMRTTKILRFSDLRARGRGVDYYANFLLYIICSTFKNDIK